jgi:uncharacterized protein (DUF924 family)
VEGSTIADDLGDTWVADVLTFWFQETKPDQWFISDPVFDARVRARFLSLHENLARRAADELAADAETALAAVIVLDQMSRNMFRGMGRVFAADPPAFSVAEAAVARGFDVGLSRDQRLFLYLPFEHREDRAAQARAVALMASLDDPELVKWAQAHRAIVDRFGRFPHRNAILGRASTAEEIEFLKQPGSSF